MIRRPRYDYDLLVLGSGAAGSTAALVAARADKKVGLIEADTFGGGAPNWGDIPVKTVWHSSITASNRATSLGSIHREWILIIRPSSTGKIQW